MLEILLDNKNGNIWDISAVSGDLSWSTARTGTPASVDFKLLNNGIYQAKEFDLSNGNIVRVRKDGANVFYGYVFSIKQNADGEVRIKAYDQVRYLLSKDTYVFKGKTTNQIVQKIAADFGLNTGRLDASGYAIPLMVEDGQTLLDIIEKAVSLTLINSQQHFVFFDDFGGLSLRKVSEFLVDIYIGDGSLMTGYDFSADIDSETYNRVKLYQDNKKTGKRELYVAQDSANIANWGLLQLYESADEGLNAAQIKQMLSQLIQLKNRETKSLKLPAVGDIRVRAGTYIPVVIESLGIKQPMLVDEAKHKFDGDDHTMSLTLKVIE